MVCDGSEENPISRYKSDATGTELFLNVVFEIRVIDKILGVREASGRTSYVRASNAHYIILGPDISVRGATCLLRLHRRWVSDPISWALRMYITYSMSHELMYSNYHNSITFMKKKKKIKCLYKK